MADNYLEKKMEEYRTGARRMMRRAGKSRAVFIADVFSEKGMAALKECQASGDCHIAFTATDYQKGSRLAQATGARFYCITPRLTIADAIADARTRFSPASLEIV